MAVEDRQERGVAVAASVQISGVDALGVGTLFHVPRPHPVTYAALDLGTNNCRLLIARPAQHGFRVVDARGSA